MPGRDKRAGSVREPVQVYLTISDRKMLKEVALVAGISAAEVLRRGLRRMAGELLADRGPVIALLDEMAAGEWAADTPTDVSARHDDYLAAAYAPVKRTRKRK